jgi:hypothetical protein
MAQAATITTQLDAPAAGNIAQMLTCAGDVENINGTGVTTSGTNDGSTYVANDRTTQGQTFTLTGGGVLNSIWVKHVSWTNFLSNGTWANFGDGAQITVRVCSVSGTALTVVSSEVATMETGSGFTSSGDSGTGRWLHITLATPVVLGAGTYAFDLTSYNPWFEMDGLAAGPYADGDAYTADPKEGLTMSTVHTGQDRTFVLDLTTDIGNDSPANGATNVPVARTSPDNDLVFTVYKAEITKVDVLFGLENDPNLTSKPAYKIVSDMAVTQGQYTVNLESLATDLSNDTTYYWKVIGYEPNALTPGGFDLVPGPVSSFTTAPLTATISAVSPAYTVVDAGQDVVLSVTGVSVESYQWYKYDSSDEYALWEGTEYEGVTTGTLTIKDFQQADEGYYYCIASNSLPSSASNRDTGPARVLTKRLTSHYPFEVMNVVDGNDVTPDVVGGFDMTMTNEAASAGLPALGTDVAAAALGTYSLVFDNADEATDPNGQFALIANDVAKYMDITIGVWVKYNGGVDWQRIYDIGASTTSYMFLTPHAGGAGLRFAITTGSGEQMLNAEALTEGEWTHVAVTIDGDTGRLYVNGELMDTNTGMTLNPIAVTQTQNYVAKSQWADAEFNGLIDDLKIYDYALNSVEVAQDYANVMNVSVCNRLGTADMQFDTNDDCRVDLIDFAELAADWLNDNRIYPQ